jgi:hypothetical protein
LFQSATKNTAIFGTIVLTTVLDVCFHLSRGGFFWCQSKITQIEYCVEDDFSLNWQGLSNQKSANLTKLPTNTVLWQFFLFFSLVFNVFKGSVFF